MQGFVDLASDLGADPYPLLRRAHLDPAGVGSHDSYLEYRGVIAALEAAARATGAGDFGRLLAHRQGLDILGPLGVAAKTAPSVGAALASIEKYMAIYSPAISITVTWSAGDDLARFEWRIIAERPPAHRQAAELALGVSCQVFRLLAGPEFRPTRVRLRHQALTDADAYEEYFGCPVEFAGDAYGFWFPASVLALPMDADSAVHAVVEEYLDTVALPDATSTGENVRRLVRTMLPTGALTLELVCAQLAVHPRTLQRDLAKKSTSFAAIVDDVRREEAERYLRDTEMPLGQLAGVLGLSEQSALTRACRRWFDLPPSKVRSTAR
ncbi:AraC family transcriptional regulator [Nocardioides stalactiti]|uniref:AraC family transcriptional regulator n=1 Tax=Nocardioides stalactiti TaxID=2755356 RepID=UPI001C81EB44|nr:AraC family transcriptional regulator [Nocardioides stalactiti]